MDSNCNLVLKSFYLENNMDDKKIKYIDQALWFITMEHYPKTIGQMKLLVSIVDKIGIFDNFDLIQTSEMDAKKLNIIYAILRIMNKIFNKYLDHVVKKIFRTNFKQIFKQNNSKTNHYNLFLEQLTQDMDHFVCFIIKNEYPNMDKNTIKLKLVEYLKSTFQKNFYENIMKKISCKINNSFYTKHDQILSNTVDQFITYMKQNLDEIYGTMIIFLEKVFNKNCKYQTLFDISVSLERHINLKNLFFENCMEIDIYSEQKLDDELENSDSPLNQNIEDAKEIVLLDSIDEDPIIVRNTKTIRCDQLR